MSLSPSERQELLGYLPSSMVSSQRLDTWIKGSEFRVSRSYFGQAYIYALYLMVAHKATVEGMASEGVSGPVTEKREGDISVSYGSGSGNSANGDLSSTAYGKEYMALLAQYKPTPGISLGITMGGLDGGDRFQSLL